MKIVSWNCNGGFRRKLVEADSLNADVLVIQECEDPAESTSEYRDWCGQYLWHGSNKNKGIGVFPKNGHFIKPLEWSGQFRISGLSSGSKSTSWATDELQFFLPFNLNGQYNVLGCWTKGSDSQAFGYMGQFWKYMQIHKRELSMENTIVAGDFNSNSKWDMPDRWWSHTDTIIELENIGLSSLYHHQMAEEQGKESRATFFLHRKKSKPYHIDYVFLSQKLLERSQISIGEPDKWLSVSDHLPLCLSLEC